MASTNVDYYQKQKDLLDSMHENESRRRNLEAQLQAYFQSDHKITSVREKLRAVKLQSYWKKICEDEKRSKQRNSQLMRDLDRIEANMAGLEARREKIRHMKEQYFDYIEQTYPQWLELVNRKKQEDQQKNRPTTNQQQTYQPQQQQQIYQQQQQQQQQYQQQAYQQQQHHQQQTYEQQQHTQFQQEQQQQKYQQHQAQQQQQQQCALQEQQQRDEEDRQQKEYKSQQTYKKQQEYLFEKQQQNENVMPEENGEGEGFIYDIPPPLPSHPPPPMTFSGDSEFQDREYTNLKNVRRQQQATTPSQIVTVRVPSVDRDEAGSPAKLRPDSGHRDPSNQNWVQADRDTSIQSLSVSDMEPEPAFSQQPIQSVTVTQKSDPPKFMEPQSDEDVSDFGDDVDLPSGDGPIHTNIKQEVHVALVHGEDDSHREDSPVQKTDDGEEEEMVPAVVHPELSTHGLFSLLRYVEDEIGNALSVEGYYRCRNPDPSTRKDIIHKANNNMSLTTTDGEFVSMVILEQLTPVVRRLPGACILSDTLLVRNAGSLNESLIRNNLHRDALQIWEKLLDHFMCLVKYHVMGTRELATVFVPCLVHQSSQHKDKTVSILETIVESAFEKKEGITSPGRQDSLDTARSSQQEGVPPLKFGSLVDSKAFTDEESSMITQSMNTEGSKLPLNETEAYKNLLSGSLPMSRPQVHADDTDENSDNELEKQYMSTFTPRSHASKRPSEPPNDKPSTVPPTVPPHDESTDQSADQEPDSEIGYIPTAPEPSTIKSVLGSTGGSSQQRKLADKLGMNSDLDTDTELDIENMVTKKEEDDDDFYDFYG